MTDPNIPTSLAKHQGPVGDPSTFERQAKAFWSAGGAILMPNQLERLSPAARAEVEKQMVQAYGPRRGR